MLNRAASKKQIPISTIAEDMSYNHGPMISRKLFDEFVAPYYRWLIPRLQEFDILPIGWACEWVGSEWRLVKAGGV